MNQRTVDARGLKCPQPVLKVAAMAPQMQEGEILEVLGDCATFEADLRKWCGRMKKTLIALTRDGNALRAQIRF